MNRARVPTLFSIGSIFSTKTKTYAEFRGGIDELELDLLQVTARGVTMSDLRRVMTRFLVPGTDPLRMRKSFLTTP